MISKTKQRLLDLINQTSVTDTSSKEGLRTLFCEAEDLSHQITANPSYSVRHDVVVRLGVVLREVRDRFGRGPFTHDGAVYVVANKGQRWFLELRAIYPTNDGGM